ncbi:glycosyl hydrolase [Paenibacillus sp. F6_3S_P_1C]|uniref:Glycosyl hydrolase n=1 Tax=Paenibacillus vandeheii TaxID=3035917 RepID=A0ABT8JAY8_9BACL|nr:glycosyl hydrolase [Paenibacillus vandeheii]MDN4602175.1 glycosyl hydrolase [Paenibacillus vandeheii]
MNWDILKRAFLDPGHSFRSVPFWAWNDKLEQEELNRQIDGFKEQGMGGFMMHVREGLETPYLSQEFMHRIKDCVAKAKESGISAWLYDEDRYSSGMGGGMVASKGGDKVRAKALTLDMSRTFEREDTSIGAIYHAIIAGGSITRLRQLPENEIGVDLDGGDEIYLIFRVRIADKNDWCHGDTYTDLMNPDTVKLFIETNYEPYREAVGEEFGKTVQGIFTDEPTIQGFAERMNEPELTWIAWSEVFAREFELRRGYSIWTLLPYFFFQGTLSPQIRYDYWLTVTETFSESYTKQIGEWCQEHGVQFTGHFHSEGSIVGQTRHSGSVMSHYRYLHIPGIDTLGEQTKEHLTIKQVSSVANQLGKKQIITETYGVTGWDLTFESRRWIGDWQFALGINLLTHHLSWYSLRGCRKRDYPPSFNYHTNWWNHNRRMEDYYARLGSVLSEGKLTRNVLVIHPASSVWSHLGQNVNISSWKNTAGNESMLTDYDKSFNEFVNHMVEWHVDYDLGDELMMKEFARVEKGQLYVGEAEYSLVVLPSLHNVMSSTLEILLSFMDSGGIVAAFGEVPYLIDGRSENLQRLDELYKHSHYIQFKDSAELTPLLNEKTSRAVSIQDKDGMEAKHFLHMHRQVQHGSTVFIVNNDRNNTHQVEICISEGQHLEEWDAWSGEMIPRPVHKKDGKIRFSDTFGPAQSRLYIVSCTSTHQEAMATVINDEMPDVNHVSDQDHTMFEISKEYISELQPVSFERTAPNALILDQCQFRMGNEPWSEPMEVWRAQRMIRERLGMRQVFHNGNLQRYFWVHEEHPGNETPLELRFTFAVADVPANDAFVVFEDAHRFDFELNGNRLDKEPEGYYLDRRMQKNKLSGLHEGINALNVLISYCNDMELENAYIIGDFAVDPNRKIVIEPDNLTYGDWRKQGYPYYCGSMNYDFEIEKGIESVNGYRLEFGKYAAVLLDIKLDGTTGKTIPWKCEAWFDIDQGLLTDQKNKVVVEVVGSPRNLFGPLHQQETHPSWIDWWSFHPEDEDYTLEYQGTPYGLLEPIKLLRSNKKVRD